jgi:hypothetical protein
MNIDRKDKPFVACFQTFEKNELLPVVKLSVPWSGYLIPNVRLSDHASFWDRGYKAVMITDTAFYRNPYYHKTSDTMDKLDFSYMTQLVHSLVLFSSQSNSLKRKSRPANGK